DSSVELGSYGVAESEDEMESREDDAEDSDSCSDDSFFVESDDVVSEEEEDELDLLEQQLESETDRRHERYVKKKSRMLSVSSDEGERHSLDDEDGIDLENITDYEDEQEEEQQVMCTRMALVFRMKIKCVAFPIYRVMNAMRSKPAIVIASLNPCMVDRDACVPIEDFEYIRTSDMRENSEKWCVEGVYAQTVDLLHIVELGGRSVVAVSSVYAEFDVPKVHRSVCENKCGRFYWNEGILCRQKCSQE
ncbi:hypothetical protein TELCIR_17363, partial [Teladorsagia circumcincta]